MSGYRTHYNVSSKELPSLEIRNHPGTNESQRYLQASSIRLKNNLMNSTSSNINLVTNDENTGGGQNNNRNTILNLNHTSPLATTSNSIDNIMRDRQILNERNFYFNQESESNTHLMDNKSASNEPKTAYIGAEKMNPLRGSRLSPKSEMTLPDPAASVNALRQQILVDDSAMGDDRSNILPNQYRETLRTNQSGVMGGKIEVMNSIDAKAGQITSSYSRTNYKAGTGGMQTPGLNGFVIGNSKFDKFNL